MIDTDFDTFPAALLSKMTVIMVTRNRPVKLRHSLSQIRQSPLGKVPVVVHDDASDHPGEIDRVVADFDNVQLIRSRQPVGPGGGRNKCMRQARTTFCLSLDDDVFPKRVDELATWLEDRPEHRDIVIVGFQCYRTFDGDISPKPYVPSGPTFGFHGGASLLRRERILDVGGYREVLFFGAEDSDLALNVWSSGNEVHYDRSVVFEHDCSFSNRTSRRELHHFTKNAILINFLYFPLYIGLTKGFCAASMIILNRIKKAVKGINAPDDLLPSFWCFFSGLAQGYLLCLREVKSRKVLPKASLRRYFEYRSEMTKLR